MTWDICGYEENYYAEVGVLWGEGGHSLQWGASHFGVTRPGGGDLLRDSSLTVQSCNSKLAMLSQAFLIFKLTSTLA